MLNILFSWCFVFVFSLFVHHHNSGSEANTPPPHLSTNFNDNTISRFLYIRICYTHSPSCNLLKLHFTKTLFLF